MGTLGSTAMVPNLALQVGETVPPVAVAEPSTAVLLALGLAILLMSKRRTLALIP